MTRGWLGAVGGEARAGPRPPVTSSDAVFNPTVTCTGDGADDLHGTGRIVAIRLD